MYDAYYLRTTYEVKNRARFFFFEWKLLSEISCLEVSFQWQLRNWIQVLYFKLKVIWPLFSPAKAKKPARFLLTFRQSKWKYESMKPNLSQKAMKLALYIIYIQHVYIYINYIQSYKQIWKLFFCYKCASFVPVCAGICHTATTHISETTLDTKKISCMNFPRPLGNVYEVSWKSDHFLNSRQKWVKE